MLRHGFTVKKCKSDGLPWSSNKRRESEKPVMKQKFQWEAKKTLDFFKNF